MGFLGFLGLGGDENKNPYLIRSWLFRNSLLAFVEDFFSLFCDG